MTAAAGILHEEFHSPAYTRSGGPFEMVQLWVNLPKKHKMSAPRYQTLLDAGIPRIAIAEGEGSVRVIAGEFAGRQGPAATFSPLNVWDVRLKGGHAVTLPVPDGHNAALAVLRGELTANGSRKVGAAELVVLSAGGNEVTIEAAADATFLLLSGEPLPEPVVGYGPFVMTSRQEIQTAIDDFNRGKFGRIPSAPPAA
jgi:redox-sensitive bicupin YhaK (pirin superfamily)